MKLHPSRSVVLALHRDWRWGPTIGLATSTLLSFVLAIASFDRSHAGTLSAAQTAQAFQVEGRRHAGPKAYRQMCQRDQQLCIADHVAALAVGVGPAADMTAERWQILRDINQAVNRRLAPREDQDVYGISDFWTAGRFVGDCEDYMISKKLDLIAAGWSADQMLYAVVEGIETPYHAVLIVRTDQGDYVLDNLTDRITRWDLSGYRFVIRQSAENPDQWVRVVDGRPVRKDERLATR